MLHCSVIVVCYRPGQWLAPCIASVAEHDVVVVDNGSPNAEASTIASAAGARVIHSAKNLGFAGGVNLALATVGGDLVALLNDDAVAEPGWIPSAASVLEDPSVAAVGPKILFAGRYVRIDPLGPPQRLGADPRPLGPRLSSATIAGRPVLGQLLGGVYPPESDATGDRWRWTNGLDPLYLPLDVGEEPADIQINGETVAPGAVCDVINNAGSYLSTQGHGGDYGFETADGALFDRPAECFGVTGAAMVATRETFAKLGGFPDGFFAYYEDVDWSWRAHLAGYTIRYQPQGVVRHRRSATSGGEAQPLVRLLTARNRMLCLLRNAPRSMAVEQSIATLRYASPQLRRSFLRHAPNQLLARAHPPRRHRTRTEVFAAWAGQDNAWGLASQAFDRGAPEASPKRRWVTA